MSEMVERAKRAGFTALMNHLGRRWPTLEEASQAQREEMDVVTRAVIAAMREPTEAMWEAWRSINCQIGEHGMEEFTYFGGDYGNWLACHHAMIDAALVSPTPSQKQPD